MTDLFAFYVLAIVTIWASLRVVLSTNPVHAVLSMIVSLISVACLFFMMGASFAGVLQLVVYAGAILVLFVFVIMMLNLGANTNAEKSWLTASAWATPFCLMLVIAAVMSGFIFSSKQVQTLSSVAVTPKQVGTALFSEYALLVEIAAFLLLGALVAAYHLGKKALDDENISHTQNQDDSNVFAETAVPNKGQQP